MQVGPYSVEVIVSDIFRLDGGAMFGSVPKVLWSKRIPADEQNRIELSCRLLLLTSSERQILVDVGMGDNWTDKETSIFAIRPQRNAAIASLLPDVTDVVLTHLHFDHAGGLVRPTSDGKTTLAFPNATHHIQHVNFENARKPNQREAASYRPDIVGPLSDASLNLIDGDTELFPDIRVMQAHGHTRGLQWLLIGSGNGALAYPSELVPTAHHVSLPYIMGYDMCAETSLTEKAAFLGQAVEDDWTIVFNHDAETTAAKFIKDERGRFAVRETLRLPERSLQS